MSDEIQIKDKKSLKAWLKVRPREESVVLAHRAAMRVAPVWIDAVATERLRKRDLTSTPLLRLNLISGVAAKAPTPEISACAAASSGFVANTLAAASSASTSAAAAFSAASAAARASISDGPAGAVGAVRAASFIDSSDAWGSVESDARSLTSNEVLIELPLWRSANPLQELWTASIPMLRDTPGGDFWIDWYQRALDGRHQNWDLLRDVALIEDGVWEEGGAALDQRITELVVRHGLAATDYGEQIVTIPQTGQFRTIQTHAIPADVLEDVLDKIRDAASILPDAAGNNPYLALDEDIALLVYAGERYPHRPRMLYSVLSRVQRRIEHRIASGDCIADANTDDLRATIAEASADLLAFSPEVRDSVRRHAELAPPATVPPNAAETIAIVDAVASNFADYPHDEMPEDARLIYDPKAPLEVRKEAAIRTEGRLLRSRGAMQRDKTGKVAKNVTDALKELGALESGITAALDILHAALRLLFWLV